ncbi:hypothetical protein ISCGN_015259 [Ixodes scapularis]
MKVGVRSFSTMIIFAPPRSKLLSQLEMLFKPLIYSFGSLSGPPGVSVSLRSRLTAYTTTLVVLTTLTCHLALLIMSLSRGFEHASIRRGCTCVRLACSLIIVVLLIRRSHEVIAFKSRLLSLYSHLPVLDPSSVRLGKAKLVVWCTAAFVYLQISYATFQGFLPDTNEESMAAYFKELWFGLDNKHFPPLLTRCLWNLESFVFHVTTEAVVRVPVLFYVAACFLLKARLRDFRLMLGRQRWKQSMTTLTTLTVKELRDLQRLHGILTEAAQQLEDVFSPIIFCSYTTFVVHIIASLYNIFDRNLLYFSGAPGKIHLIRQVEVYLEFGLTVWFFLLLTVAAAFVNDEPSRLLPVVEKMILDVDELSVSSSFRAAFLLARFSRPFAQLTAWRVCVISRGLVLTVMGAFLTYGVIFFQFVHLGNSAAK